MAGTSLGYPHENVVQGGAVDGQLMDGQIRGQALHKLQGLQRKLIPIRKGLLQNER
jgi:hypothetical protein